MRGPAGLAVDGENNLYVVDSQNHRVQKFTKDGQYLAAGAARGATPVNSISPGVFAPTARVMFT